MYKTARNLAALGTGLGISALVGWLLLRESRRNRDDNQVLVKSQNRSSELAEIKNIVLPLESLGSADSATSPVQSAESEDDLTHIKDIGPRFSDALRLIGITTYAQLAGQNSDTLAEQLSPHVSVTSQRIHDRDWIGQAAQLAKQ